MNTCRLRNQCRLNQVVPHLFLIGTVLALTAFASPPALGQTVIIGQAEARQIAREKGWIVREESPAGVIELQAVVNGIPKYYMTHNADAADSISTDECLPGGSSGLNLTGSGVTLGIWDGGGVRTSHQEYGGRATQIDSPSGTHYHSTHVAGTMIASGVVGAAKGMSPSAYLDCWDWDDDDSEMRSAASSGLLVSNHSYSYVTGWYFNYSYYEWFWYGDVTVSTTEDNWFGLYTSYTEELDDIAYDNPYYLMCRSAGNDRTDDGPGPGGGHYYYNPGSGNWEWSTTTRDPDGPWDCIGTVGVAKNILSVAAVDDVSGGYSGPGSVSMSSFSSYGPADDGRIKPDIAGNGIDLYSCDDDNNSDYTTLSGTSMSSPNVSGSLGVLIQHYRNTHGSADMRSATLKGLVLHTADECGSSNGPDYKYGWGLMNTLKAANTISDDASEPLTMTEQTLSNGGTIELYATTDGSTSELRASICWTDPPGTPPGNLLNPTTKMLVNDLNLRIEKASPSTTYYPWVLNPASPDSAATTGDNDRDNVEQVVVSSPGSNSYTIRVTHDGSLSGGSQAFSLIVTGAASLSTTQQDEYTLTVNITGNGSVDLNPPGGTYLSGTPVTLTANADPGWHFDHWEDDLTGSTNPDTIVMDGDKTVTAVFIEDDSATLAISSTPIAGVSIVVSPDDKNGNGDGVTDFQRVYYTGEDVTLTAPAGPIVGGTELTFCNWEVDGLDQPDGETDLVLYNVDHDVSLVAEYLKLGDTNGDGEVDENDIELFIEVLLDPAGFETSYGPCRFRAADMNHDQVLNGSDIQGFIYALIA
ncbi:MAG: S8 family serine peptidase [Phycisphaerae bacterium]|nr:S8 family serine peptidase [Phycisphaerae bacterium]